MSKLPCFTATGMQENAVKRMQGGPAYLDSVLKRVVHTMQLVSGNAKTCGSKNILFMLQFWCSLALKRVYIFPSSIKPHTNVLNRFITIACCSSLLFSSWMYGVSSLINLFTFPESRFERRNIPDLWVTLHILCSHKTKCRPDCSSSFCLRRLCPDNTVWMCCCELSPSTIQTAFRIPVPRDQGSSFGRRSFQTHRCLSWQRRLGPLWSPWAWNLEKIQLFWLLSKANVFLLNIKQHTVSVYLQKDPCSPSQPIFPSLCATWTWFSLRKLGGITISYCLEHAAHTSKYISHTVT